jgi:hypothetical protein
MPWPMELRSLMTWAATRERIASAIATLDAMIQDIRTHVFNDRGRRTPDPAPPNGDR